MSYVPRRWYEVAGWAGLLAAIAALSDWTGYDPLPTLSDGPISGREALGHFLIWFAVLFIVLTWIAKPIKSTRGSLLVWLSMVLLSVFVWDHLVDRGLLFRQLFQK